MKSAGLFMVLLACGSPGQQNTGDDDVDAPKIDKALCGKLGFNAAEDTLLRLDLAQWTLR